MKDHLKYALALFLTAAFTALSVVSIFVVRENRLLREQIARLEEEIGKEAAPEVCPTCGAEKKEDAAFCGECGGPL